jgi:hypothetical protein
MPVKNSKQNSTKSDTPVMEAKPDKLNSSSTMMNEPVPEPVVELTTANNKGKKVVAKVTPSQNGGKKVVAKVTPVTETEVAVAPPTQKGGKKGKVTTSSEATTVETTIEANTETPQKGGKKNATATSETPQKGGKKAAASKNSETPQKGGKKVAAKTTKNISEEDAETVDVEESNGRRIRSFKVQLPGKPDYEGRFTGLTPYQAANKALSKYFRETEQPEAEITFSICESTRKSKKSVYTYNGKRQKLNEPVEYEIKNSEGTTKVIIKNFKNSLKKVKKSEIITSSV